MIDKRIDKFIITSKKVMSCKKCGEYIELDYNYDTDIMTCKMCDEKQEDFFKGVIHE